MDVFSTGELIRIKATGEVFVYESSTGGANFSSYLIVNILGEAVDYNKSLHVDDVEKVSVNGHVIDDFESLKRK
jgi:hypothetical protein